MCQSKVFAKCVCVTIKLLLFSLLAPSNGYVKSYGLESPAKGFSKYEIIQPLVYDGRTKRDISTTRDSSGIHLPEVEMVVTLKEETLVLELRREEDLVAERHALHYQPPGDTWYQVPHDEEWCHYRGHVRHRAGSWCAVSTCHGVSGVVFDGRNVWYIQPADDDSSLKSKHYVYNEKDKYTTHRSFNPGSNNTGIYLERERNRHENHYRYKRNAEDSKSEPYRANKHSRYVELVLVADYAMYKMKEGNEQAIHREMEQLVNIVNAMYAPLNIFIILVDVVIWNNGDKITIDKNGLISLKAFLDYRAKTLINDIPNDHALLISGVKFDFGVVGKSLPSAMCTLASSGSIVHYHTTVQELMAATLAHEMGHSFGMLHDGPECECPDEKCIMDQSSNSLIPVHWSSCSLKSLTLELSKGIDYCLRNKPRQAVYPSCGNGLLEPGEQCDCGKVVEGIDNACVTCCNPETCLLRDHATCAGGACCDLSICKPKLKGTICRPAEAECEIPEYCTGDSGFCPEDMHLMDTTPCGQGKNQAYCYKGACRSHQSQCQKLWGQSGSVADPACYSKNNVKGIKNGNCGYSLHGSSQHYKACSTFDVECGLLHCWHTATKTQFGTSVTSLPPSFLIVKDKQVVCNSVLLDVGASDVDPGLVPDGARCHTNGICVNQRCLPVQEIKKTVISRLPHRECLSGCSGHGRCNSQGLCHCDAGFAPPLCKEPTSRGSQDSGSSKDPRLGSPQNRRQGSSQEPKAGGPRDRKPSDPRNSRPGGSQEPRPTDPRDGRSGGTQVPRPLDPRDRRPGGTQEPNPGSPKNHRPSYTQDHRPENSQPYTPWVSLVPRPGSSRDNRTDDSWDRSLVGSQNPRPMDPRDGRPDGSHTPRPRGSQEPRPLDPRDRRPGGSQKPKPGSPRDHRPGYTQDHRPSYTQDHRPENSQPYTPRVTQVPRPGRPKDYRPDDPRNRRPGGSQEPRPTDPRDGRPRGSHEPRPLDPRDRRPGISQAPKPESPRDYRPGSTQDHRPGDSQASTPRISQIPRPGSPRDYRPDDQRDRRPSGSQGTMPGVSLKPRLGITKEPTSGGSQESTPRGSQGPRPGDSQYNGPVINYGGQTAIKISLYVIFLCILPILLLILLGWYCWKKHPSTMTCHCCKPIPLPFISYRQLRQHMRTVINHVKPNQNTSVKKINNRRVEKLTIQHQTIEIVKASNVNVHNCDADKTNTIRYLTDTSHNGNRIRVDTARIEDTHIYDNQNNFTKSINKFNASASNTTSNSAVRAELKKLKGSDINKTTIEIVEKVEVARPEVKPQVTKKPKVLSANTTFSANKAPSQNIPDIKTQAQFNTNARSTKPLRCQSKAHFTVKPNTNTVRKPNLDEKPQLFTDVKLKPVPKSLS